MKAVLIIDIQDDLLEDYENFYVDYDLRADRKDEMIVESIKYVEDCQLRPIPDKEEIAYIANGEVIFIDPPKIDDFPIKEEK